MLHLLYTHHTQPVVVPQSLPGRQRQNTSQPKSGGTSKVRLRTMRIVHSGSVRGRLDDTDGRPQKSSVVAILAKYPGRWRIQAALPLRPDGSGEMVCVCVRDRSVLTAVLGVVNLDGSSTGRLARCGAEHRALVGLVVQRSCRAERRAVAELLRCSLPGGRRRHREQQQRRSSPPTHASPLPSARCVLLVALRCQRAPLLPHQGMLSSL